MATARTTTDRSESDSSGWVRRLLQVGGFFLLIAWAGWWAKSLHHHHLVGARQTWVSAWSFLGLDFQNNYYASRHWLAGGDPYRDAIGDPNGRKFCYPPPVLPLFAWCGWVDVRVAVVIWTCVLAGLAVLGAVLALRTRRELALSGVPWTCGVAAILYSTPVLFALERGNCDLILLLPITAAALALRSRSRWSDAVAGSCLALAAAIKIYPAFLVLGLLPLRRFRAFAWSAATGLVLLALAWDQWFLFRANVQELVAQNTPFANGAISSDTHSISGCWLLLWPGTRLAWLARIPGVVGALLAVLPGLLWISWRIARLKQPNRLLFPYFTWIAACATFVPPVSNDYNLFFLPLSALALWDRRDPVPVHMGMTLLLLWAEPLVLSPSAQLLLAFKFLALAGVGLSLATRLGEQADRESRGKRPIHVQGVIEQRARVVWSEPESSCV